MIIEDRDESTRAQHFEAMGHSIALVKAIVAGTAMSGPQHSDQDRRDCVDRNTRHLIAMKARKDWAGESMSATTTSIAKGKRYKEL